MMIIKVNLKHAFEVIENLLKKKNKDKKKF